MTGLASVVILIECDVVFITVAESLLLT